jgi:hypothetical protein
MPVPVPVARDLKVLFSTDYYLIGAIIMKKTAGSQV